MRITFDRPMSCAGFFAPLPPFRSPCSHERQSLVLSFDRRIVRIVCATAPGQDYAVMIGPPQKRFISIAAHDAQPYALIFRTSQEPSVGSVSEALAQDREAPKR